MTNAVRFGSVHMMAYQETQRSEPIDESEILLLDRVIKQQIRSNPALTRTIDGFGLVEADGQSPLHGSVFVWNSTFDPENVNSATELVNIGRQLVGKLAQAFKAYNEAGWFSRSKRQAEFRDARTAVQNHSLSFIQRGLLNPMIATIEKQGETYAYTLNFKDEQGKPHRLSGQVALPALTIEQ